MATHHYSQGKRLRELAKKQKQEGKRLRRQANKQPPQPEEPSAAPAGQ